MWTPSYDIIIETLTGSEFEVTVNDRDTVGYLKAEIQKYEGIPISQQHLLYNHKELSDTMEMKDIPLVKGSRVKLVLGMKGGPISSKRLFTISSDYDNWLDMSDVLSGEDLINLQSPGLKLLLYKDSKKNVHRLMKVRAEKSCDSMKGSMSRSIIGSGASGQGAYGPENLISQKERDAAITKQKMDQIKAKLSMKKKRLGGTQVNKEEENEHQQQPKSIEQLEDRAGFGANDFAEGGSSKAIRNPTQQYRHKKRHHHYHHHQHHHHHQQHPHQHETVIKEEKTPIGYRPGTAGSGGGAALVASGHNASMVGTIGSMLPSAGTASAAHRKSMPTVIDIGRSEQEQAIPPISYGLVNLVHGTTAATTAGRSPTLELEKRSQIREHLQRNRSFKTISAKNLDFVREGSPHVSGGGLSDRHSGSAGLERSLSFHSNGILSRMGSETTLDSGYSNIRRCTAGSQLRNNHASLGTRHAGSGGGGGGACTTQSLHKLDESRVSSASLHDLIELLKYTQSKQRTISNDSLNKLMLNYSKKVYVPHHLYHHTQTGKKSLPEINPSLNNIDEYLPDYDFGLKTSSGTASATTTASAAAGAIPKMATRSEDSLDCKIASAEYAFKNAGSGGMDKSVRTLYKATSEDSSVYELPKLLIREDSPVESFLGSYSQLETVAARRGESPKNNFTASNHLQDIEGPDSLDPDTQTVMPEPGLLELRPLPSSSSAAIVGETKLASESLLQFAQIAAESVKSSQTTATSLSSSSLFGSNSSLTGTAVGGDSISFAGTAVNGSGSSSAAWCQHWNHRQEHQQPHDGNFASSSVSHLINPRRHHSDLDISELELKFINTDANVSNRVPECGIATNDTVDHTNLIKLPAIPNLGTDNGWLQLSSWDTVRFGREDEDADDEEVVDEEDIPDHEEVDHDEEDDEEEEEEDNEQDRDRVTSSSCSSIRRPRESSNSTSFIHSHLSISSDEDDLLNVAEMRDGAGVVGGAYKPGGNKSKSIDLNEFRKAFGSSPTLLNGFRGGASCTRLVPQLSRLETIPSQYRRGYTNLNDACLSSSTSELECVSNGAAKKKHPGLLPPPSDDSSVLSSALLKYRKDGSVPYVRSNENLNRYKISLCTGTTARRRMGDSDEALAGSDALYLRQRQQSIGAGRHLPSIRDHLASIADSEANESADGACNGNKSVNGSNENANPNRAFVVGSDFESRFSRLSCCSAPSGDVPSKPFSPGGNRPAGSSNYRAKEHSSTVGSSAGLMRTTSTADDRSRFLFGEDATSSLQYNGSSSSTHLKPTDYYFPSDESLFNMDSFFDDFVEIDTSDIFESTEFININSGGSAGSKCDTSSNASTTLVLPDIHPKQQHPQQPPSQQHLNHHTLQRSQYGVNENLELQQHQLRVLRNLKSFTATSTDDARRQYFRAGNGQGSSSVTDSDGVAEGGIHFSAHRAFLQAGQNVRDAEEEGIASIIQHIDQERLCEQRTSSLPPDATMASSIIFHDDSERLLRLTDYPADRNLQVGTGGTNANAAQHHTTEQIKSKKLRCAQCNKKLGVIMIMKCHCEKIFCAQHRYAEAHNCSYDFKVEGRKVLEKNNPLVVADKLPKI